MQGIRVSARFAHNQRVNLTVKSYAPIVATRLPVKLPLSLCVGTNTMNPPELIQLSRDLELDGEDQFKLRVAFGVACIERVEHLLTDHLVINCLSRGKAYLSGEYSEHDLAEAAAKASQLAKSHSGSSSIDGTGSAAVSTSHGVAAALAGRALVAAEYAAYARVYSYASHAVTDLSAYEDEHAWQLKKLQALAASDEY